MFVKFQELVLSYCGVLLTNKTEQAQDKQA
jgi:hypothetical protein